MGGLRCYETPEILQQTQYPSNSKKQGRAFPVNLVGGGAFKWSDATGIEPKLHRNILAVELGGPLRRARR
jgi:hypothetical protein